MKTTAIKIPKRVLEMMRPYMELNETFGGELSHYSANKYKGTRVWRAIYYPTLYGEDGCIESVEVRISYNKIRGKIEESVDDMRIPISDIHMALDALEVMKEAKHRVA